MLVSSRELFRIPEDPVVSSRELVLLLRRLVLLWDLLCCEDLEESCRREEDLVLVEEEFSALNWEMSAAALSLLLSGLSLDWSWPGPGPALRGRRSSSDLGPELRPEVRHTTGSSGWGLC